MIIQSTQISGTNTFEEVVDASGIPTLADPLRDEVMALVGQHGTGLQTGA